MVAYPVMPPKRQVNGDDGMKESAQQGLETTSEAVYADCVSDDGRQGFVVRLCRYPEAGFAWMWFHLFVDNRIYAYTEHTLACDGGLTDLAANHTSYALDWPSGSVRFLRSGDRSAPGECSLTAQCTAHEAAHPPHGPGPIQVHIDASFRPSSRAVSNLAGRTEVLGVTSASAVVNGRAISLSGHGQFHEQVQTAPRFTTPFTYLTLRGPDLGFIGLRLRGRSRGFLLRPSAVTEIVHIGLSPPGSIRRVALRDSSGGQCTGELITTHDYSVPVFDGFRPGTLVSGMLEGQRLSGCVNDYLADGLAFERMIARGLVSSAD